MTTFGCLKIRAVKEWLKILSGTHEKNNELIELWDLFEDTLMISKSLNSLRLLPMARVARAVTFTSAFEWIDFNPFHFTRDLEIACGEAMLVST